YFVQLRIAKVNTKTPTTFLRHLDDEEGKTAQLYLAEVRKAIKEAEADAEMKTFAEKLAVALDQLEKVTVHQFRVLPPRKVPKCFLLTPRCIWNISNIIAHCMAVDPRQATFARKALQNNPNEADANFYNGKIATCRYFFSYELPKIEGLSHRLLNGDGLTVTMKNEYFED
ncbi:MAG: acyl-CoA dehydrogenase C-terminal domain-containing protein, partial [Rhodopseudomonas palustris]|nr:acyl-CoA dehydrogenase C-terminal domain-containing protein [Rhodopseudomonas palustris]